MQNARCTYWSSNHEGYYPYKEAPHGTKCGGCSRCAHCDYEKTTMNLHMHGWWKETDMKRTFEIPDESLISEWVVAQEVYGRARNKQDPAFKVSSISISIFPIYKENAKNDWEDEVNVVARASTYVEILDVYSKYVAEAVRREKAMFLK